MVFFLSKFKVTVLLFLFFLTYGFTCSVLMGSVVQTLYKDGVRFYGNREYALAIKSWRALIKEHRIELSEKQQLKIFLKMSSAYEKLGKTKGALKCLSYAERLAPEDSLVIKARKRLESSESGPTVSDLMAGKLPKSTLGPHLKKMSDAIMLEKVGAGGGQATFIELKPVFEKAIAKGRELASAYYGVGACLFYLGGDDFNAEMYLKKSNKLDPQKHVRSDGLIEILVKARKAAEPPKPKVKRYEPPRRVSSSPPKRRTVTIPKRTGTDGKTGASPK